MQRLNPFLIIFIAGFWIALQGDASLFALLSACLIGIIISWIFSPSMPKMRLSAIFHALTLFCRFSYDVIVSNYTVALQIVGKTQNLEPFFVTMPLASQNPTVNTLLADMITLTPGTLGADVSTDNKTVTIHCLSAQDPDLMIATLQQRYEKPLIAIFGAQSQQENANHA